mgnify:CR=1 FL=1
MDLNFSKKTRKIVASLLAVAILLGVLPVSGLTGNSSGAESSSSENSTKTIYVNSTKQPILFDPVGNFKEIIPKVKKNIYSTEAENGDKIALFTDIGNGNSVVFYKTTEWTPSAYMWKEDSSENPDKNAAWPGETMKKYGDSNSSLYYYVYGSAKGFDKVIFNDGNDQNGDQTDNKDLKVWNVYTKTSAGRPICDSLTKCDVSDNFNVYEYADSKLSGKNISAPQGMGATIEIAGTKYTVCGDGAKSEITCYEDDEITSLTANTVDGYTAKVTNSVVGDNQITYSVTYTNKTYGMQFSVENTVTFIKNPRLVLEGKWTVTFNGKKYENGDTICNQKDSVKNLEAAFKIDSVTFNGKEISGYDAKTTLNGNSFDSSCGSNELEKENKLVATVYYEADNGKKYSAKSEFSFKYSEGDVTLSENEDGDTVYFDGNNIYTNSDSVTLTLNDESKIEDLTLELYKGDSTPDSKNKIENAIEFDHEKGTITIGNKDVKLSEIKRATLTITSSKYNLSKTYTISYDTISKDNLKYSNTNENNERYYVNAEKGVTVTFNLVEIDKKLFNDENAEVTCDKENGVKISFNKDNKEWKATITKSADYTFTFSNNGFVQTVKITKQDLYLDDKAPEITGFSFQKAQSDTDKLLSFLTFGIYSNDKIIVTVNAKDEDILSTSSGIKNITLYDDGKILGTQTFNDYSTENTATFTLDESDKAYKLYAVVEDAVGYKSQKTTFDLGKKKDKDSYDVIEYNSEDSNGCLPELVSYSGNDKFSDLAVTPNEALKTYEKGNLFGYNAKDEAFKLELSESLSALSEATVTVSKEGSAKSFSTNPPITFNTTSEDAKKKDCKLDYDLKLAKVFNDIGVSGSDISGKYTIKVKATNNASVTRDDYTYEFSIDNTAPKPDTFTISGESSTDKILKFLTFGIYSKKEIKVNVTANDKNPSSGIKTYTLYELKNDEYRQISDPTTDGNFTLVNRDEAYNLFVRVTDKFDNESDYYTFDYTGNKQDSYTATYDEAERPKKAPELVSYNGTDKFSDLTVTPENFKHQDNKGLFSYKKNGELFNIKLSESLSALSEATVTVNKDGSAKSFSETITFDTTSEDAKKKDCKLDYDLKLAKVFNDIGVSGSDISGKYTIKVKATNNASVTRDDYTYEFSIDNTAPVITLFAIENGSQNPIVDETSSQEYRYYFQHNTNVTVTAKDSASGVKEIHFRAYDVVKKDNAVDETKTVSSNNNAVFEVPANFKGEIYAYAVDKFDNSSIDKNIQGEGEKKPDDLIVETQQHHNGNASVTMSRAKASYKDNSGLDLYSGNVNARVVFEDTYAGIKDATITVYDYTNAVTGTIYAEIGNDGSIEKTEVTGSVNNIIFNDDYTTSKDNLLPKLVIDYVVTNNSNNIKITTSMTDRAGNKTDNVKDSLSIDKTKPVIDVKYDNNEHTTYGGNDYYKADRTATVTVTERNFDESLVEAAIMRNGGRYTTIGGWTHNNNTADPDKSTHVAKIVYNTDGDFTFDIAVKDKAMNSADKFTQQKFTVDKTAPVIDVSFDNNSAKNGNYYKADRTATIKITEHNFNSGSQYVNIPVTAEGTTAPSVVGWSGSGNDHNATVSFNKDGKYSFTVDYTDLAGNKAVQKKVDSFYIDKTAPEVEITGVADHQAYNGTVAPVVTYRDDNFTDDHDFRFTKIDINGKSDDTSKFDYDTGGNGVTEFIYKYRDFAEVLENDGIYNFTVELSDKAGNSTSKSVTFSVNRFGSTFKASDESKKLINNGYTNAEQDIVIEEINVTPLTKHSVTLAKSGGNSTELVENTDYTFTSSNNGNEWCKSVYTVNKKNFSDEAAYTVTIMSVDKAKNTNNNRMADSSLSTEQKNKRECAISFVVDKTSPLVSITGIKDNELYKEASKKVKIVCEDDNLDKSKLVVTLDNKKLAEGEDYTIVDDKDGSIAGMLTAEIVLKAETGGIKENLKVTIGDLAGNTGEKSVDNFILSANIFQRFFANPVLVICTFAGLALVIAAVIFFVAKKRKKAE